MFNKTSLPRHKSVTVYVEIRALFTLALPKWRILNDRTFSSTKKRPYPRADSQPAFKHGTQTTYPFIGRTVHTQFECRAPGRHIKFYRRGISGEGWGATFSHRTCVGRRICTSNKQNQPIRPVVLYIVVCIVRDDVHERWGRSKIYRLRAPSREFPENLSVRRGRPDFVTAPYWTVGVAGGFYLTKRACTSAFWVVRESDGPSIINGRGTPDESFYETNHRVRVYIHTRGCPPPGNRYPEYLFRGVPRGHRTIRPTTLSIASRVFLRTQPTYDFSGLFGEFSFSRTFRNIL